MNQAKEELIVWVNIEDSAMIEKIYGFIPVMHYKSIDSVNKYEFGMVEQNNLIVRYRVTSFIKYIRHIFFE